MKIVGPTSGLDAPKAKMLNNTSYVVVDQNIVSDKFCSFMFECFSLVCSPHYVKAVSPKLYLPTRFTLHLVSLFLVFKNAKVLPSLFYVNRTSPIV